jgi:hypothetical protein
VLTAIEWQQSVSTSDYVWINDVISRNSQQIESPCVNTNIKEKNYSGTNEVLFQKERSERNPSRQRVGKNCVFDENKLTRRSGKLNHGGGPTRVLFTKQSINLSNELIQSTDRHLKEISPAKNQ